MSDVKVLEIRDRATFIPALAIRLGPANEQERYLLARAGYGRTPEGQSGYVVMWRLTGGEASCDPYDFGGSRTMATAHQYVIDHFDELEPGAVVDVEYILGETPSPKVSEAA